jgi:hypothetical protein
MDQEYLIIVEGQQNKIRARDYSEGYIENDQSIDYCCTKSRNHNGYIREKATKYLSAQKLPEVAIPYLVLALGDYVFEVSKIPIDTNHENLKKMKKFVKNNEKLINYLDSVATSYWNEYYRSNYKSYHDYPPYKFLQTLKG